jgi:predicted metal-dependent hydrolase
MHECGESPPPLLREGIAQFNRGEYFEQHETLELLWRGEPREVRRLYQGILQIGVALHHLRRGNYHGTVSMLTRGARYVTPFSPWCQGVDVERLLRDAARVLTAVERLGPDGLEDFDWRLAPIVHLSSGDPS